MKRQRKCEATNSLVKTNQTKRVVPMPVRQDDAAPVLWVHLQTVQVVNQPVGTAACVEQQQSADTVMGHLHDCREAMSTNKWHAFFFRKQRRHDDRPTSWRQAFDCVTGWQHLINQVVVQGCYLHLVDGCKLNYLVAHA